MKATGRAIRLGAFGAVCLFATTESLDAQRASPMEYARATIAGHPIEVQYGRPSTRGREIFGALVPYGSVWRTGANEATHLRSPVDLVIGEVRVAAGEYTLYTIPDEDGWTLIINTQTGQWGTAYDEREDLVRVPMAVESTSELVERFTISVREGEDTDGVLR
jgi:hypothetical protein